MATDLYTIMAQLQAMGVYDYLLPFLLIFAIVFAILEKLMIFGHEPGTQKPRTNINMVISLILGLLVTSQPQITYIINSFLPKVSLFILVALMFLVIAGMFGAPTGSWKGIALPIALVICIIAILWALSGGTALNLPYWLQPGSQDRAWIILIATVVLVVAYIGGGKDQQPKSMYEKLFGGPT